MSLIIFIVKRVKIYYVSYTSALPEFHLFGVKCAL